MQILFINSDNSASGSAHTINIYACVHLHFTHSELQRCRIAGGDIVMTSIADMAALSKEGKVDLSKLTSLADAEAESRELMRTTQRTESGVDEKGKMEVCCSVTVEIACTGQTDGVEQSHARPSEEVGELRVDCSVQSKAAMFPRAGTPMAVIVYNDEPASDSSSQSDEEEDEEVRPPPPRPQSEEVEEEEAEAPAVIRCVQQGSGEQQANGELEVAMENRQSATEPRRESCRFNNDVCGVALLGTCVVCGLLAQGVSSPFKDEAAIAMIAGVLRRKRPGEPTTPYSTCHDTRTQQ